MILDGSGLELATVSVMSEVGMYGEWDDSPQESWSPKLGK